MDLENKIRLNELYDIYGELLTEKQRTYYEYYYLKDYSLSEISEILEVSRNAVHMQLKNVVKHLENYENKLKILDKNEKINNIIKRIDKKELSIEDIKNKLEKV
ncbi:YlxM family DNA-binding protein [Candidatus Izemoplasma sp. B36]|uniref:YlxM family DNA-binding protein n=1 Tax=Candidatus Izemoplasma sp. B36 TaxID=3242468 RepID=UPI003558E068